MKSTIEQQGQREPREKANGCPVCGKPVPVSRTRPFIFCSHRCRQRPHDLRKRVERRAQALAAAQAALDEVEVRIRKARCEVDA
jgi:endogenous inhibitor of DNA gyrase (YacG/DUF329 family)